LLQPHGALSRPGPLDLTPPCTSWLYRCTAAYDRESPQYAWLLRDLAAVDRARTPWVIAVQHAPWYNSNYAHQGEGEEMREAMELLLYQHGVDFVFSGARPCCDCVKPHKALPNACSFLPRPCPCGLT
jgi:hypothetical protein